MIIVLKKNPQPEQMNRLITWLESMNIAVHSIQGETQTVLGLVGDTTHVDPEMLRALDIVADARRIQEPYPNASRRLHEDDTIIPVGDTQVGGGVFSVIAGPCSIESEEQICEVARAVKRSGATMLRGGAFKPRTSPYTFQGLRGHGLEMLLEAKRITELPVVTEIMDLSQLDLFDEVDVIQVGARNMQNFELLKELGHTGKPILIKRGLSSTLQELLMSAEYVMAGGNDQIILCERGIRTFETATRNTLDLAAVPMLKKMTHLPVIVDPSHATGVSWLVKPMAMAAVACGADGLMIEVHNDPSRALCDGAQSLKPEEFDDVMQSVRAILPYAFQRTGG
ncbi:MAG: 3-deoxy-7-phosphoheptulonate synthase [Clostridia bacterium]|nr:3-deoxy-7-phosphoheptulonate synthase [Clostridia bacterium]